MNEQTHLLLDQTLLLDLLLAVEAQVRLDTTKMSILEIAKICETAATKIIEMTLPLQVADQIQTKTADDRKEIAIHPLTDSKQKMTTTQ